MNLTRSWSCPFMSGCTFTTYMGNKQGCTCFGCFCSAPGRAPHAPMKPEKATSVAKKLKKCWVQYWYSAAKSTETTTFCRDLQRLHLEGITFWNPFVWSCKLQPYLFAYQLHQFQHWAVKTSSPWICWLILGGIGETYIQGCFWAKSEVYSRLRELEENSTVNWMSSHETWGIFAAKLKARSVKLHLPGPELRPSMSSIHHSRPLSKSLQSFKIKLCQTIWHAPKKKLPPSSTAHNLAAILAPICTPSEDFSTIWRPAQSTDGGLMTCEACLDKPTNRESSGEKSNF